MADNLTAEPEPTERLTVGIAQIAPIWLDRERTIAKVVAWIERAAARDCRLVAFGEALVPGYPFWIEHTDGARFDSPRQKEIFARYAREAVQIEAGHLALVLDAARKHRIAVYLGCIERPADRGGHSLYASLVHVAPDGTIGSVHRKLVPTYEERLAWSPGDGHGLRTHALGPFTLGGLNCWENWMPLARAALYAQGEDVHVAVWPGNPANTQDITRFIAKESRSYVLSACGYLATEFLPSDTPQLEALRQGAPAVPHRGGSCIAGPDGAWIVEPVVDTETLLVATLDHRRVREERQNFDAAGHYARPDVTRLVVDRTRQSTVEWKDGPS